MGKALNSPFFDMSEEPVREKVDDHPMEEEDVSMDQSTDPVTTPDPKIVDQQFKHQINQDNINGSTESELSFVASHVIANFRDSSNITLEHSRPLPKREEGMFKFTIGNVPDLRSDVFSPPYEIAHLPWRLCVHSARLSRTGGKKFLAIFVECNYEFDSTLWSCDADVKLSVLCDQKREPFMRNFSVKYKNGATSKGFLKFMEWNRLMDGENGYVKDDEVTIEVQVTINKLIGFRSYSEFDFISVGPVSISDVMLVIEGKRVRVCKHYLSIYSPVFHAMFFSEFTESAQREITLEDIKMEEFLELLHTIYPTHKPVTEDNVEFLLKLGDRFEVQFVIEECEKFLISADEVQISKKLVFAEKYCLAKLQDVSMKTIKTLEDLKELQKQDGFKEFTSETKAALLDRILKVK